MNFEIAKPQSKRFNSKNFSLGTEKFSNAHPNKIKKIFFDIWQIIKAIKVPPWFSKRIIPISIGSFLLLSFIIGFIFVKNQEPKPPKINTAPPNSLYLYETGNADFSAKIGSKNTAAPYIVFTPPSGTGASFNLIGSQSKGGVQVEDAVVYKDVFPNTDVTYTTLVNGIKEEFVINAPTEKAEYLFDLRTTAHPRTIDNVSYSYFFFDENNNYQFNLEKPFAVDAIGNRTEDVSLSIRQSKVDRDLYQIQISLSQEWLTDPRRVFPVTLDPTIVHDVNADFATGIENRINNYGGGGSPALSSLYTKLEADHGTVALWHLDELKVIYAVDDASSNVNDGTSTGTTLATAFAGVHARTFNGTSDTIAISNESNFDFERTSSFSIETWIKTSATATQVIVGKMANSSPYTGYELLQTSTGVLRMQLINTAWTSGIAVDTVRTVNDGVWHHVAATYDGSSKASGVSIYVDGESQATSTAYDTLTTSILNNVSVQIGSRNNTAYYFNGTIDEVRISNIARSPEEIKANASRYPYSIYTSDVIDFTQTITSWNSLSWTELGVATGDGETLKDTTGLFAQWNFNETSGTTANNDAEGSSCGGTPANCDLTLSGFDSTASQDADPDSSWTANNRRWGAGALQFDGINSAVYTNTAISLNSSVITITAWVNWANFANDDDLMFELSSNYVLNDKTFIVDPNDSTTPNTIALGIQDGSGGAGAYRFESFSRPAANEWHHYAFVFDNSTVTGDVKLFIDGKEQSSTIVGNTKDQSGNFKTDTLYMMNRGNANLFAKGILDSVSLFTRELTSSEIMSNYNAGNIEFQTRVGPDTTPDDGNWEEWRPVTGETQIDSFDGDSFSCSGGISSDSGRIHIFVTSGTFECTGSGQVEVLVVAGGGGGGTNMGGGGGGGGVIHNRSYSVSASTPITVTVGAGGTGAPGLTAIGHPTTPGTNGGNSSFGTLTAIGGGYGGSSPNTVGYAVGNSGGSGGGSSGYNNNSSLPGAIGSGNGTPGQGFRGGYQGTNYYSGGGGGAGGPGSDGNGKANGGIGYFSDILGPGYYWGGGGGGGGYTIEGGNGGAGGGGGGAAGTTVGGSGLNPGSPGGGGCTVCWANRPGGNGGQYTGGGGGGGSHYYTNNQGGDGGSGVIIVRLPSLTEDTTTKIEGTGSQKITTVKSTEDANTVAFWHMDETGGTGAYIKSTVSAPFATGGVVTQSGGYTIHTFYDAGTFVSNGTGNVEVLVVGGGGGGGETIGGGGGGGGVIKNSSFAITPQAYSVTVGAGGAGGNGTGYPAGVKGGNSVFSTLTAIGGGAGAGYNVAASGTGGSAGGNGGGGGARAGYTASQGNDGGAQGGTNAAGGGGGAGATGASGVSNVAGNGGSGIADTITGSTVYYGAGGGGGARNGSGTPGTGGTGGGGNGGVSTAGVAGLDGTGSGGGGGGFIADLAGGAGGSGIIIIRYPSSYSPVSVSNNGTPTGTSVVDGINNKARSFNGTSDYIDVPHSTDFEFGNKNFSIEWWSYLTTDNTHSELARDCTTNYAPWIVGYSGAAVTDNRIYMSSNGSSWDIASAKTLGTKDFNKWNYYVVTRNGNDFYAYKNGVLTDYWTSTGSLIANSNSLCLGRRASTQYFGGSLDEVKIRNVALSAEEVSYNYQLSQNKYSNKTLSSLNLSTKSSLPFYVAADRPGTYLQTVLGESAFANSQPDTDTVGLWHLDDGDLNYPRSCYTLRLAGNTTSGTYTIDPDGPGGKDPFSAYCNMTYDGGGWTMILKSWYGSGLIGTSGAVGAVTDATTLKGNAYKLADVDVRNIIGTSNNFDIMVDQNGYNSLYSAGNYEFVVLRNYTGLWTYDRPVLASTSTTSFQSYRASDQALAWTGNLGCGSDGGYGTSGINCYTVLSNNPQGGAGCTINMGTTSNTDWHHFFMNQFNDDTYIYICNGAQHSSGQNMNHRFWVRERNPVTAVITDTTGKNNFDNTSYITATGGTVSSVGGYTTHTFTSNGTFTVTSGSGNVEAMVVAGGGGGANTGSGGGAGGYVHNLAVPVTAQAYSITVGAGGAGGASTAASGAKGQNSVFSTITAEGGGYGTSHGNGAGGGPGGSGGGGAITTGGGAAPGGTGSQGGAGGAGYVQASWTGNSGGGGGYRQAGVAGGNTSGTGNGGYGIVNGITGTATYYAGGGGAGEVNGSFVGAGGIGGGGSAVIGLAGGSGTANTGGGGAGGSYSPYANGGNGGSGIVVIRYPNASFVNTPVGATHAQLVDGKIGKARYFNGTSDLIDIPTISGLTSGSALSWGAWFKPSSVDSTQNIILSSLYNIQLEISASNYILVDLGDGSSWCSTFLTGGPTISAGNWYYAIATYDNTTLKLYLNGQLVASTASTCTTNFDTTLRIGEYVGGNDYYFPGIIDEVRIDSVARTADEIRQAYEVGLRSHNITVDFSAKLVASNLISNSSDTSFNISEISSSNYYLSSNVQVGEKIIVKENYDGTDYIAQGTVWSNTYNTGAVTVSSWDSGSTFPSGGYTANADVFKWQREYWPIAYNTLSTHMDAITNLSLRITDGNEGRNIWIDDLKSNSNYLTDPTGSTITSSTGNRYMQYRAILTSLDPAVSATLSAVTVDYVPNTPPVTPSLDTPLDTAISQILLPDLNTTTTDADSDYIRYKIELCTDLAMTTACQTFDQTSSQTGWSGQDTQTNTAYASGTQATYTLQTPLAVETTYYWRSYGIDPGGTNSFGNTQVTPYSFNTNFRPSTPTLDLPINTAINQALSPILKTTGADVDGDYLQYKIELCTDLAMTTACQTFDQTISQTGWSGQNAQTSTAYTSGTQATYTIQTPLADSTTYYWRSYATDPAGTNLFGTTQDTPYSFTTSAPPTAPTVPYAEGSANPTGVIDTTPEFSAIHNDPDGDAAVFYEINVNTNNTFTGTVMWASGQIAMASLADGVRSTDVSYAGTAIPLDGAGTTYYWRIRFTDIYGIVGAWSDTQNFSMNILPGTPSLDLPADAATEQTTYTVLKTTTTDTESDYLQYKIQICTNAGMTQGCQTFDQTSSQTGWSGQDAQTSTAYASGTQATYTIQTPLISQTVYHWRSYAKDPGGSNNFGTTQSIPYTFTTITNPNQASSCTVEKNSQNTQIIVRWTDNSSVEDGYQVWKVTDGGTPAHITPDIAANLTSYTDTAIASNHTYGYLVRSFQYDGANTIYSPWCKTTTSNLYTGGFTIF